MRYVEILLERNILNVAEINSFTDQVAQQVRDPQIQAWIKRMLPAYLKKTYPKLKPVKPNDLKKFWPKGGVPEWAEQAVDRSDLQTVVLDQKFKDEVASLPDYLGSEDARHNLARIPFDVALKNSKAWHRKLSRTAGKTINMDLGEGVKLIKAYPGGYKWVQLTTPECLDAEGNAMGHCVGRGYYDQRLKSGNTIIYSFRDKSNQPHITIEVSDLLVSQVKGKQNKPPVGKYAPYVLDLLNRLKLKPEPHLHDLQDIGIFYGEKGYGTILEIAAKIVDLPSGAKLVLLNQDNAAPWYIVKGKNDIVVTFEMDMKEIAGIKLSDDAAVFDKGDIKTALEMVLLPNGFTVSPFAQDTLARNLGWMVKGDKVLSLTNAMELFNQDLQYRAFFDQKNKIFLLVNEKDDVLIYSDCVRDPRGLIMNLPHFHNGWEQAIPFLLESLKKANIQPDKSLTKMLKLAGFMPLEDGWVPASKIIEASKEVFETSQGHKWFALSNRHDGLGPYTQNEGSSGRLYLYFDNKIMASLIVKNVTTGEDPRTEDTYHTYGIKGIDAAFTKNGPLIREDIVDLFENQIAEIDDPNYDDQPFLISYQVVSDGYDFSEIDFDRRVNVVLEYWNEDGIETKHQEYETSFYDACDTIGADERWYKNRVAETVFLRHGTYEDHRDYGGGELDDLERYYYDDPAKYREDHDLDADDELPEITHEYTYITLA